MLTSQVATTCGDLKPAHKLKCFNCMEHAGACDYESADSLASREPTAGILKLSRVDKLQAIRNN